MHLWKINIKTKSKGVYFKDQKNNLIRGLEWVPVLRPMCCFTQPHLYKISSFFLQQRRLGTWVQSVL